MRPVRSAVSFVGRSTIVVGLATGALVALAVGCGGGGEASEAGTSPFGARAERPNVVLVISDDQDNEHFGFRGNAAAHTPTLDALAAAGTVFSVMHTPPRCRPSLAVLLSGRAPQDNGIYYNQGSAVLDAEGALPLVLRDAGYATFAGGKFWEGDLARMGFDAPPVEDRGFVREGQDDLFAFIDAHAGRDPMFVWWAPSIPHMPHDPPAEYVERIDRDRIVVPDYLDGKNTDLFLDVERECLAMGTWFDTALGTLRDKLDAVGELDDTLFVFLIDNGYCNGLPAKASPFEKGVSTPCIVTWPKRIPPQVVDALTSSADLYPTILELAGVEVPGELPDARSLVPLIDGRPGAVGREVLFGGAYDRNAVDPIREARDLFAIYARNERWKYVLFLRDVPREMFEVMRVAPVASEFHARGRELFYDLDTDPHELVDLSGRPEHREAMDRMRAQALSWWSRNGGDALDVPR